MHSMTNNLSTRALIITIGSVIALSWYYMTFAMTMNMEPISQWNTYDLFMLFVMWTIMMFGMMLPSAIPVILIVNNINQQRISRGAAYVHSVYFVIGYLSAWAFYSLLITFIQYWLHHIALLTPMMISNEAWFSSALLFIAGVYQWLPIKQRCLNVCRSPMGFLMKEWGEGHLKAIKLGFKHGQYCLGCCWFLMALLFVAGVMNLKWIAILTFIVVVEKMFPKGELLGRVLGLGLIVLSIFQLM